MLLQKFEAADLKYDNSIFQFPAKKYPNEELFVLNLNIFMFLHETSHFEKFEGTDFKSDNSLFKFRPKNRQFFHERLLFDKLQGTDFKWDSFFKF